jgi:hypothetical protein
MHFSKKVASGADLRGVALIRTALNEWINSPNLLLVILLKEARIVTKARSRRDDAKSERGERARPGGDGLSPREGCLRPFDNPKAIGVGDKKNRCEGG